MASPHVVDVQSCNALVRAGRGHQGLALSGVSAFCVVIVQ